MKKLIERLRNAYTWVNNGGASGKDWKFQRNLSDEFSNILKLLGRYSIQREQKTEQDDEGNEKMRTVTYRVEPIITKMEVIKNKYHPAVPREDTTKMSTSKKVIGSSGKSRRNSSGRHK